jgi:hypothetical protein
MEVELRRGDAEAPLENVDPRLAGLREQEDDQLFHPLFTLDEYCEGDQERYQNELDSARSLEVLDHANQETSESNVGEYEGKGPAKEPDVELQKVAHRLYRSNLWDKLEEEVYDVHLFELVGALGAFERPVDQTAIRVTVFAGDHGLSLGWLFY